MSVFRVFSEFCGCVFCVRVSDENDECEFVGVLSVFSMCVCVREKEITRGKHTTGDGAKRWPVTTSSGFFMLFSLVD